MKTRTKTRNKSGFTLIELMVALTISVIVLTGVMSVFSNNSKSYLLQDDIAGMQENLRSAMVVMQRDVQMAGSGMPGIDSDPPGGFTVAKIIGGAIKQEQAYPLTFQNNRGDISGGLNATTGLYNQGKGRSDMLTIRYNRVMDGSCGEVPQGVNLRACDMLPQISLVEKMPTSSPEAKIEQALAYSNKSGEYPSDKQSCKNADGSSCYSIYPWWDEGCWCGSSYTSPQLGFFAIITSPDGLMSDILQVDGIQGSSDPKSNTGQNKLKQKLKVANEYPEDSKISFFTMRTYREVMYYVQDNNLRQMITTYPDPGAAVQNPTIQDQPLAENIEDLQFAFLLDSNKDGTLDTTWINSADLTPAQSQRVRLVRINIMGRTSNPGNSFATTVSEAIEKGTGIPNATQLEDHDASEIQAAEPIKQAGRYYSRKLIQTVVKVRALGL